MQMKSKEARRIVTKVGRKKLNLVEKESHDPERVHDN
jgi:hypothetical protein